MSHTLAAMPEVSAPTQDPWNSGISPQIKTHCKILLSPAATFPAFEDCTQHWGVSAAIDGIAAYQNWVSGWLLPIAFLWIYKNKEEICKSNNWPSLPDDIDRVVRGALKFAKESNSFDENFQVLQPGEIPQTDGVNETWSEFSNQLRTEIHQKCEYPDFSNLRKPA